MISYTIRIPGKPIAKARPRFYRRGKHVGTYNSQVTEEGRWMLEAKQQIKQVLSGPVMLSMYFYLPRPKAHFGTGKNAEKLKGSAPQYPLTGKDLDNMVKFAMDCLNKLAWNDDAQVIRITASKEYSRDHDGGTMITITET